MAEALMVAVLRVQVRPVEVQAPSVGIRDDLRLPVDAVSTPIVQTTAIVAVEASEEEGEGNNSIVC